MLVTADEAKTKWCPQTERDINVVGLHSGQRCIAIDCMAWRWVEAETQTMMSLAGPKPEGSGWEQVTDEPLEPPHTKWRRNRPERKGLCGLAGGSRG